MRKLKVYIGDEDYEEDAIAFRYYDGEGCRVTGWLRESACRALGLEKGKTYEIVVEQVPDEYI